MAPRRTSASPVAGLLALAAAAALGVALTYLLAVRTAEGRRLDDSADGDLREGTRAYEETSDLLDTISVSSLALLGGAIMAVALVRGRPRLAVGAGVLVIGANVTTQYLKATLDRPGPAGPEAGSFPSGHVTVAMSLAMALVLVAPPALRLAATLVGGAYATAVGVAVLGVDWHRPSDVVGAYLVTVTWTALVAAALASPLGAGELRRGGSPPSGRARAAAAVAAVLGLGFVGVVTAAALSRLDLVQIVEGRTSFVAAAVGCAAACAVLAGAVVALVHGASSQRAAAR